MNIHKISSVPASVIQVKIQQDQILATNNVQVIRKDRVPILTVIAIQEMCSGESAFTLHIEITGGHSDYTFFLQKNLKCQSKPNFGFTQLYQQLHKTINASLCHSKTGLILKSAVTKRVPKPTATLGRVQAQFIMHCRCSVLQSNIKKLKCSYSFKPHFASSIFLLCKKFKYTNCLSKTFRD